MNEIHFPWAPGWGNAPLVLGSDYRSAKVQLGLKAESSKCSKCRTWRTGSRKAVNLSCMQRAALLQFMNMRLIRELRSCVAFMRGQLVGVSGNGNGNLKATPRRMMSGKTYNVPPSSEFVARVSGIATMAKLPYQDTAEGLDAAFIGVPIDTGTSNRPGTRFAHAYLSPLSFLHCFPPHLFSWTF